MEQSDFHEKFAGGDVCVDRSSESVTCQTFELTLRSCLYPHIDKQYLDCCGNLMQTLKKDYRYKGLVLEVTVVYCTLRIVQIILKSSISS